MAIDRTTWHCRLQRLVRCAAMMLPCVLLLASSALAGPGLHPPVRLVDDEGRSVVQSGGPVSAMRSCAECHDTAFIAGHSTHSPAALHATEMNCFLCHLQKPETTRSPEPTGDARRWATTATLAKTGLVQPTAEGWKWNNRAFNAEGFVAQETLGIQKAKSTHCGTCHGLVPFDAEPITLSEALSHWRTANTGQIFSPQRISASGLNLADKASLTRPWDIHAERLLQCSHCHHSANNPAYAQPLETTQPAHLRFDARRLEVDQYLKRPSHAFVHGEGDTMRRCNDCHESEAAHDWLPYQARHMQSLSCEACHIPEVAAPAYQQIDRTVLTLDHKARIEYRGIDGPPEAAGSLVRGYRPVLLPHRESDGSLRLLPHNIIASWHWVAGQPERPVSQQELEKAFFENGQYHPEVLAALDANHDGHLSTAELALDTPPKVQAIQRRLASVGVPHARIQGQLRPRALHHGVVGRREAIRECRECHSGSSPSRLTEPFELAVYLPGGVRPTLADRDKVRMLGELTASREGRLVFRPSTAAAGFYVLGHDRSRALDWLGGLMLSVVVVGISVHAALRIRSYRKETKRP